MNILREQLLELAERELVVPEEKVVVAVAAQMLHLVAAKGVVALEAVVALVVVVALAVLVDIAEVLRLALICTTIGRREH